MLESPFNIQKPVTPPIFVSREDELSFLEDCILYNDESVVLEGLFGIGKSSTILTFLEEKINSGSLGTRDMIFPVRILMTQFYDSLENDFLSTMTHELVANIWISLLGYNYSQLLEGVALDVKQSTKISKYTNTIRRIYKIVSSESFSSRGISSKELSGKLFLAGKKGGSNELSIKRKPLQTFEFLHLIDELMEVLSDYGYGKILFFCDELNHLPPAVNYEIISGYIDAFSSKKILFALTATDARNDLNRLDRVDMKVLIGSFSKSYSMGPFKNSESIKNIISNSLSQIESNTIEFDTGIETKIFEITKGYPWFAVKLCNTAYLHALKNKLNKVDQELIERFADPIQKSIETYMQSEYGFIDKRFLDQALSV